MATEMDTETQIEKPKIAFAMLTMPDGKKHEVPLPSKTYSSGRKGFYAHIPTFVYDGEAYGGQIQVWKKTSD
jgi:hypothetical protein